MTLFLHYFLMNNLVYSNIHTYIRHTTYIHIHIYIFKYSLICLHYYYLNIIFMILCLPFIKFDYTCTIFLIHFIFFYILHYIISQRYIFLTTDFLKKIITNSHCKSLCPIFHYKKKYSNGKTNNFEIVLQ